MLVCHRHGKILGFHFLLYAMPEASLTVNTQFFSPKYWPLWLAIALFRSAVLLPYPWQMKLGGCLGRLFMRLAKRRRAIAQINIDLCYPLSRETERHRLVVEHFESLGKALFETSLSWWASPERLRSLVEIDGLEHLRAAVEQGRGVILLGAHYTTLEISGAFMSATCDIPIVSVYRPHENALLNATILSGRERLSGSIIPRHEIKAMIRALRQNKVVWLASDQNFGHKSSVFAPFFGVPAATNTSPPRLAKLSGAVVMPFASRRLADNRGYRVTILPPLSDFPSQDLVADMTRVNATIEKGLQLCPEQYIWVHRRFKDRPPDSPDVYNQTLSLPRRHGLS